MERSNAVVAFLEADVVVLEHVGEEEESILEANGPRVRDALDEEVPWVLERALAEAATGLA